MRLSKGVEWVLWMFWTFSHSNFESVSAFRAYLKCVSKVSDLVLIEDFLNDDSGIFVGCKQPFICGERVFVVIP